jgi:hypothetical protein
MLTVESRIGAPLCLTLAVLPASVGFSGVIATAPHGLKPAGRGTQAGAD